MSTSKQTQGPLFSNKDICRRARLLIHQYGDSALLEAMKRVESFHITGDKIHAIVWHKIANAVEWMLPYVPANDNATKY